jgi:O-antigen ligase
MFFVFWGTNIPFQSRGGEGVENMVESNIVNQLIFTVLFLLALLTIIPKIKTITSFLKEEKYFSIFLLWCLATIFWSDYSFISFKRYFQFVTVFLIILSIITYVDDFDEIIRLLNYILIPYIFVTVLSLVLVPKSFDSFGNFRGMTSSKNTLGQIALVCILLWGSLLDKGKLKDKIFYLILLVISILIAAISNSATVIITAFLIFIFNYLLKVNKEIEVFGFKKIILFTFILFFVFLISSVVIIFPDFINVFFGDMGKDVTFTGRTDIWMSILDNARSYILTGCGYQGFWVSGNPFLEEFYQENYWLPLQSHNGFIDILNELGIIGLILFILIIIKFFKTMSKLENNDFIMWLFIAVLILNLTESTIIRPRHPTGVMMMLAYLISQKKYQIYKYSNKN